MNVRWRTQCYFIEIFNWASHPLYLHNTKELFFYWWVLKWLLSQLYDFFLPVVTASLTFKQKLQLMKVCVNSFSFCNYCHTMTVQHHICGIFTYISNLRNTHWLHWLFLSRFKFFILFSYCCIFYTEVLFT